jgi:hypothetical protein
MGFFSCFFWVGFLLPTLEGGEGGGRQEDQEEGQADGAAHLPGPPHAKDDGGVEARDPGRRDVKREH